MCFYYVFDQINPTLANRLEQVKSNLNK